MCFRPFLPKKKTHPDVAYSDRFLPFTHKTFKRWKYDSIPYGACVMLDVYDVCHHRVKKILVGPLVNENPALSKVSALESVFKTMRFG